MKISYNWLKQYIGIDLPAEDVSKILTSIGLEVEAMQPWQSIKGGLQGLVVGEVKTCAKHPDADKLSITTVDVGRENLLNVVCGAPNVAAGQKVIVATENTILYNGDESFTIKKTKIRGAASEGMICAEDEIGIGTSHAGIMVLPAETKVGTPASDYFKVENDIVFEIGITPNRIDAASHYGVARDLAAYLNQQQTVSIKMPDVQAFKSENNANPIQIKIEDTVGCKRYAGITISGIQVAESPEWLKNRLLAIGQRPINNIVDITNFVLHELGQPLHAFDADQIKEKTLSSEKPKRAKFFVLWTILKENCLLKTLWFAMQRGRWLLLAYLAGLIRV